MFHIPLSAQSPLSRFLKPMASPMWWLRTFSNSLWK